MKPTNSSRTMRQKSQRGISLIEVLVAIIVMTFGLLGISGLMMAGVNNSTGSDLASRANQSASEIMDAMRANRGNAASYAVDFGTASTTFTGTTTADKDLKQWLAALALLPGGTGQIKVVTGVNTYEVKIRFANCIGTLNKTQLAACIGNTASSKRELTFVFKV
jgi:type IV pilus assembly protein PilV